MGELYLVRHGQANSGAKTEEDYDRLSPLGHQQAAHLGDWLRSHEAPFDHILSGTMRRHIETATSMGFAPQTQDSRLNEMDYFALARDMEANQGLPQPTTQQDFAAHIPQTLQAWHDAKITGTEPFAAFETRIQSALKQAARPGKRLLCITSGGVISMAMRHALGLGPVQTAHVLLPIFNSSLHRFRVLPEGIFLSSFNTTPHLDAPNRTDQKTHL